MNFTLNMVKTIMLDISGFNTASFFTSIDIKTRGSYITSLSAFRVFLPLALQPSWALVSDFQFHHN
jgi:hypothetical protein